MRKKQTGPSDFIIMAAVFLLAACASAPPVQRTAQNNSAALTIDTPSPQRPLWINQTPESAEFLYFTGMAEADSESEARNAAVKNGFADAAGFYGSLIQSEITDHSVFIENMGRVIAEATTYDDKTNSYTNTVISEVRAIEYYTETYRARNTRVSYKVWALCRIPRQKAEEDRANFVKNISEQYTRLLDGRYDTLSTALHPYSAVLAALEQNPLHRAIAVYGDGQSLFGYCRLKIIEIVDSLLFDDIPPQAVQKGGALTVPVRVSSLLFPRAGPLECTVTIQSGNRSVPGGAWTLGGDNSFLLRLPVSALEAGNYTITLELALNTLSSAVTRNPGTSFPLEVKPLNTVQFLYQDAESLPLGSTIQGVFQTRGLLPVPSGGAYLALISLVLHERNTVDYYIIQPSITISVERDGTPLLVYAKRYGEFAHRTREAALERAYRNIETDLDAGFAAELRSLER
jgi:hypothetical protein